MADPINDDVVPPRWEELIEMTDEQVLAAIDDCIAARKARAGNEGADPS